MTRGWFGGREDQVYGGRDPITFLQDVTATATTTAVLTPSRTLNQALTATVTTTATIVKRVGTNVTATVTSTASIVKRVNKAVSATATSTASMVRQTGKNLTATTVTTTATIVKRVGKLLSATVTSTASLSALKVFLRTLSATVTSTATVRRQIGKLVSATASSSATIARLSAFLRTLTATVTSSVSITKRIATTLSATASSLGQVSIPRFQALTAFVSTVAEVVTQRLLAPPTPPPTFTIELERLLPTFPIGTEVSVWEGDAPVDLPLPGEAPPADPVMTVTVTGDDLVLTGLVAGHYFIGGLVGRVYRPARGYPYLVAEWEFLSFLVP